MLTMDKELITYAGGQYINAGYAIALAPYQGKGFLEKGAPALSLESLYAGMRHDIRNIVLKVGAQPAGVMVGGLDGDTPEAIAWIEEYFLAKARRPMIHETSRGFHALFQHTLTNVKNRIKAVCCGGADIIFNGGLMLPPSVHPTGIIYRSRTGIVPPDELPVFDGSLLPPEPVPQVRRVEVSDDRKFLVERARRYVARIDGAVSGQRGHYVTYRVAAILLDRFGLSIDEAWPVIAEWNRTCIPQWSDDDLMRKLREAQKKLGKR